MATPSPELPGMGQNTPLMPSGDPVLPSPLVNAYATQQVNNTLTQLQSDALLSGQMNQMMALALVQTTEALVNGALNQIEISSRSSDVRGRAAAVSSHHQPPAPAPRADNLPAHPSPPTPPEGRPAPPEGQPAPPEGQPQPEHVATLRERYSEGYQGMQHATMGSVARQAARGASRYLQEHGSHWGADESGNLIRYDHDGNEVDRINTTDPDYNGSRGRSVRRAAFLTSTLGRAAAGEGIVGSLGSMGAMVGRLAGPIGIGVAAVQMGGKFLESQNQAAATYRQAFGEQGTGLFAAQDRLGEFTHGLTGFGTIGMDRAREEYQQASELGLRGDRRDQATDFSRDMYMRFGMDTAQSMQIVQQSIQTGNASLSDFADAISSVSKAAVDAGKSSQQAVQDFVAAQRIVAQTVAPGDASTAIAANLSQITAGMTPAVAASIGGTQGLASTLGNQQTVDMLAMVSGTSPLAAEYQLQAGGATSVNAVNALMAGGAEQVISMVASQAQTTPEQMKSDARSRATRIRGTMRVSVEAQNELLLKWGRGSQDGAGLILRTIESAMRMFAPSVSGNYREVFFSMLLGDFAKGRDASGYSTSDRATGTSPLDRDQRAAVASRQTTGSGNYAQYEQGYRQQTGGVDPDAISQYRDLTKGGMARSKAFEALLSNRGEKELKQQTGDTTADAQFTVHTPDGPKKVSLGEIMSNPDYRRQFAGGTVEYTTESGETRSVSEITGVKTQGRTDVGGGSVAGAGQGGTVQVEFTGKAKEFFKVADGPTDAQRMGIPSAQYASNYTAGGQ